MQTSPAPRQMNMMDASLRTMIGKDSADPFPMLDRSWDIFSGKGIRTVFVSIGNSKSVIADLEIAEGLGCPINYVPLNESESGAWSEVASILKDRKREESASAFSANAETKWILPKNVRSQAALPWWGNGTLDLSSNPINTQNISDFLRSICTTMKVKDNITRLDILKVDSVAAAPGLEKAVLGAVLNAGFRPAIILVHWSQRPDVDLSTTIAAGNLQNCGYRLMSKIGNKFLYYFTDDDMYQLCSWEETAYQNPLLHELVSSAHVSFAQSLPKVFVNTREDSNVSDSPA